MAAIESLRALLVEELRDIYDAEQRLTKALPKLAEAASNDELITVLKNHLGDTQEHVKRVEQAFADLKEDAKSATCVGMKGVISEGEDHMDEDYGEPGLRDAAIIGFSQRVEHYEIAAYGTAIAHAACSGVPRLSVCCKRHSRKRTAPIER